MFHVKQCINEENLVKNVYRDYYKLELIAEFVYIHIGIEQE